MERIFKKTLDQIVPTHRELEYIDSVIQKLSRAISQSNVPEEIKINFIEPQGSTGIKQTSIRDAADIDLFIGLVPELVFSRKLPSKTKTRKFIKTKFKEYIKDWLIPSLENIGVSKIKISYAEHPYISAKYDSLELDVVLCFDLTEKYLITNGPITAVDRSPHHSRFIQKNLNVDQKNDVRLLKYFFKCQHSYGDKAAVGRNGFMGYLAELFIVYFNTIEDVLIHFLDLEDTFIHFFDKLPYHEQKAKKKYERLTFTEIQSKFFPNDALIVIDPTDYNRNVASSISARTYAYMKSVVKDFLENPKESYFIRKPIKPLTQRRVSPEELKHFFYLEYELLEEEHYTKIRDKLYSAMQTTTDLAERENTGEERFQGVRAELYYEIEAKHYILAFYTETPQISEMYVRKGPKANSNHHGKRFLEKNPAAFEKDGYYCVNAPRSHTNFIGFLKERTEKKKIRDLKIKNIGEASDESISIWANRAMGNLYEIIKRVPEESAPDRFQ